jgi:DNA polymerase III subunit beta
LPLMHREDYPNLPVLDTATRIGSVHAEEFADAVRIVGAFASGEEKLVSITALNVVCNSDELVLSATDRYIIGRRRLGWSGTESAVIDVSAADLLATIKAVAGAGADDIELLWDGALLGLRTPSATVITRSLAEKFPDIDPVIARTQKDPYHCTATVPTAELTSMLRRAAAIADDQNDQVDIVVDGDALSIATTNSATGNVADSISAVQQGGSRSLALNSKRLLNALNIVDDKYVTLAFQGEDQSVSVAHMLSIFPGEIEDELRAPDTDSSALLIGIRK